MIFWGGFSFSVNKYALFTVQRGNSANCHTERKSCSPLCSLPATSLLTIKDYFSKKWAETSVADVHSSPTPPQPPLVPHSTVLIQPQWVLQKRNKWLLTKKRLCFSTWSAFANKQLQKKINDWKASFYEVIRKYWIFCTESWETWK